MFFLVLTFQETGRPFIEETMLRCGVPPHIGQSSDCRGAVPRRESAMIAQSRPPAGTKSKHLSKPSRSLCALRVFAMKPEANVNRKGAKDFVKKARITRSPLRKCSLGVI